MNSKIKKYIPADGLAGLKENFKTDAISGFIVFYLREENTVVDVSVFSIKMVTGSVADIAMSLLILQETKIETTTLTLYLEFSR